MFLNKVILILLKILKYILNCGVYKIFFFKIATLFNKDLLTLKTI